MANYMIAVARGRSQNRFIVSFSSSIDFLDIEVLSFDAIIDTGCTMTKLSLSSLGRHTCSRLHAKDISNYKSRTVSLIPSYGVTDINKDLNLSNVSDKDLKTNPVICFKHSLSNMRISGYSFGDLFFDCKISYVQTGLSLIGMNVLNQMDFHCGYSRILHKFVFLGCLKSDLNRDYIEALQEHFGYLPDNEFMQSLIASGIFDTDDVFVMSEYSGLQ